MSGIAYYAPDMLLVYTNEITPRIEYTFNLVLGDILGLDFQLITSEDAFEHYDGPKCCYSVKDVFGAYKLWPVHPLLFEQDIRPQELDEEKNDQVLKIHDPFASAFFIASRYEEYLPHEKDIFRRYEANQSILYKKGILDFPVVHAWADGILKTLKERFPLEKKDKHYAPVVTIDVDQAFSYKHKGLMWSTFILLKNLVKKDKKSLFLQTKVLRGKLTDPFDSFSYLATIQQVTGIRMIYFIHAGRRSKYDRPIPVRFRGITRLVKAISQYAEVGLHPSFQSNENDWMVKNEKMLLEKIIGKPVILSRQHYLRLSMPVTYRKLISEGIREDFTMGYATEPGFRAGLCIPFYWFDVKANHITSLKIHPVSFMEGTFFQEKNFSPGLALDQMKKYIDTVKKYNGQLIAAWHNHTITDHGVWMGGKNVFEGMMEKILDN